VKDFCKGRLERFLCWFMIQRFLSYIQLVPICETKNIALPFVTVLAKTENKNEKFLI
jgi:hypothetical protein